jgi:hypothetical protein
LETWRVEAIFEFPVSNFEAGADVAQLVERVLGKDEVSGSIPLIGSRSIQKQKAREIG